MNIPVVFLHGLESDPENSGSANYLKSLIPDLIVPDYKPKREYNIVFNELKDFLNKYDTAIVIGISIGGYWALELAKHTNISRIILINPALVRGANNYNTNIEIPTTGMIHLLVNMDDELINNEENVSLVYKKGKITKFENGGHRVKNKEKLFSEVLVTVNFFKNYIV